jgi:hypothetical protein
LVWLRIHQLLLLLALRDMLALHELDLVQKLSLHLLLGVLGFRCTRHSVKLSLVVAQVNLWLNRPSSLAVIHLNLGKMVRAFFVLHLVEGKLLRGVVLLWGRHKLCNVLLGFRARTHKILSISAHVVCVGRCLKSRQLLLSLHLLLLGLGKVGLMRLLTGMLLLLLLLVEVVVVVGVVIHLEGLAIFRESRSFVKMINMDFKQFKPLITLVRP